MLSRLDGLTSEQTTRVCVLWLRLATTLSYPYQKWIAMPRHTVHQSPSRYCRSSSCLSAASAPYLCALWCAVEIGSNRREKDTGHTARCPARHCSNESLPRRDAVHLKAGIGKLKLQRGA